MVNTFALKKKSFVDWKQSLCAFSIFWFSILWYHSRRLTRCIQAMKRPLRIFQPERSKELFRCDNNCKKYAFCVEIYIYIYISQWSTRFFFWIIKGWIGFFKIFCIYMIMHLKLNYILAYVFTQIWYLRGDEKLIRFRWRVDRTSWYTRRFCCKGQIPQSRREL